MARGRRRKQITIKDPESLAILGVICLVVSALLFISLFVEAKSEVMEVFRRYFGVGVIVMSALLFILALRLFGTKNKFSSAKVTLFILLFMFSFLGWIQLFADIRQSKILAEQGQYGGIIGYQISTYAKDKVGIEGALVSLGIIWCISILISFKVTPNQIGEWITKTVSFIEVIFRGLRKILIGIIHFIKYGKSKIDNLEMNIVSRKKDSNGQNISTEAIPGISKIDPNMLTIKMVSDISGKKDLPTAHQPDVNINIAQNAAVPNLSKPSNPSGTAEELDLSVRNYPNWMLPGLDLLDKLKPKERDSEEFIQRNARAIQETLKSFNIEAKILGYSQGPSVTQYFIDPAAGVKFTKIANLSKDLALTLASPSDLRIELVPGKSYIGIDVPNEKRQITQLRESLKPLYDEPGKNSLGLGVGIDTTGSPVVRDLQKMPHLLVAGATGMGKSVLVNAFIVSMLMQKTPDELKFIMIDPKMVEMAPYDGIPHLLTSPITDMSKASTALKWAVNEMEERYKTLKDARARNIEQYIKETGNLMPYIVVIIDEFSDLMMQYRAEVESSIIRLAQKSRAVGIHLIVATQRPTADVITGLIKSNIPARVALTVASSLDSRVVLDSTGAETLLGKGDLLFKTANDLKPVRIQGLWMPDDEFNRIINFIKEQAPDVQYNEDQILTIPSEVGGEGGDFNSEDPLFRQAAEIVISAQKGSASLLQTKMKIGYARAARLIDELEMAGIVGPQDGPRPREVMISDLEAYFSAGQTMGE
jgi:S-DNA-T family DNA segregation ATPase FtsK/SpoIIIE